MPAKTEYEFSWPPKPDHLEAIGMLVVETAVLDNVLELAIWQINQLTFEVAAPDTLSMSFRKKSDCFLKSAKVAHKSSEDQALLKGIEKDLKAVGKQRGMIVHGSWAWGVSEKVPVLVKYRLKRKRIIADKYKTTPADIRKMAANASRTCNNVINFLMSHGYEPLPLREE